MEKLVRMRFSNAERQRLVRVTTGETRNLIIFPLVKIKKNNLKGLGPEESS
jgi:hypothetical protein